MEGRKPSITTHICAAALSATVLRGARLQPLFLLPLTVTIMRSTMRSGGARAHRPGSVARRSSIPTRVMTPAKAWASSI